ncbi:Kiwa anti-phage protein KwaB-like domain-containing protein [Staphylococcus caprae]|uniref:Kiwa anti-phage protein KwaB-like domain-containing protein n=1 Tax=Staphylococcus caprae TaxID=29380 RepID=UPI003B2256AA
MDLESIFDNLKNMKEDEIKKSVRFSLEKKAENDTGKNLFYEFDVEGDVQLELFNLVKNYFNDKRIRDRSTKKYDAVIQRRGETGFYLINKNDYTQVSEFIERINNDTRIKTSKNIDIDEFIAYVIAIEYSTNNYVYYIGEISALSSLNKTKFIGNITDDKLKKINEKNLVGFNQTMAMFIHDNEMLINQIRIFEKLCNMHTEFEKLAKELLDTISSYDVINNFEEFKASVEMDNKFKRRLAKLNETPDRVIAFLENIDNVKDVLDSPDFKDKFEGIKLEDNKLKYEKTKTQQFITLISDSAYESIVGKQKRLDEIFS